MAHVDGEEERVAEWSQTRGKIRGLVGHGKGLGFFRVSGASLEDFDR